MINKKLKDEIWDYCRINDITDVNMFIEKMTQQGYNLEKYGNTPMTPNVKEIEKIVEVEVIKEVEKVVEVEVEKIVIKEVPVEVIKEVEVEKEVYITNDKVVNKLQSELDGLKKKMNIDNKEYDRLMSWFENSQLEKAKIQKELDTVTKELVEEKKIPKREKKEIKLPEPTVKKSSINWVSKNDRNIDNLYDD